MKRASRISVLLIFMISVLTYSCKNEEKSDANEEATAQTSSAEEMKASMEKSADLKYNPAHGEEGHRCELPVGAPLDQKASTPAQEMNSSPVRLQSASPKINPPHGEPGHDCSVAVGAELP